LLQESLTLSPGWMSGWVAGTGVLGLLGPAILFAVALFTGRPAAAHHSYSMFDASQRMTLSGTLRELQWTNPHCFLQVLVTHAGITEEWSVQMDSPQVLYRRGWRPGTLKPGDKFSVVIAPTKDGSHSGRYVSGAGPDGKTLKD
jgi:hypothetical protein